MIRKNFDWIEKRPDRNLLCLNTVYVRVLLADHLLVHYENAPKQIARFRNIVYVAEVCCRWFMRRLLVSYSVFTTNLMFRSLFFFFLYAQPPSKNKRISKLLTNWIRMVVQHAPARPAHFATFARIFTAAETMANSYRNWIIKQMCGFVNRCRTLFMSGVYTRVCNSQRLLFRSFWSVPWRCCRSGTIGHRIIVRQKNYALCLK